AATKSVTFGVLCTLTGVFLYLWLIEGDFNIKLLLGISFLLFTAPIGGHLMARAAYLSGVEPDEITEKDELKEVVEEAKQKENIPNKELYQCLILHIRCLDLGILFFLQATKHMC